MANSITPTTTPTKTLLGHTSSVWTSCFTRDASHIATCSSDETVRIWGLAQERVRQEACLNLHTGVVRGCDYSPQDSALLATCSWDKTINIHSTADYMVLTRCLGHEYGVTAVRFSPSGRVLASCSWDDNIGLWDMHTGTLLGFLRGHTSPVATCVFLQGDSILASCSWDGTVRLWDLSCPTTGGHSTVTMREHPDAVYDLTATPSDPNLLISCGRKGSLVLWDLRSQVPWQSQENKWAELNCVCLNPGGSHFVAGDNMGELQLWNLAAIKATSLSAAKPKIVQAHACTVTGLSFSRDGSHFASSSSDQTCRIWLAAQAFDESPVATLADSLANQLSLVEPEASLANSLANQLSLIEPETALANSMAAQLSLK